MELSKRLAAIAKHIPQGAVLADVGTDHALLPCFLAASGRVPKAYAMDIAKGPLERAALQIKRAGLEGVVVPVLSDGFEKLPDDATAAVAAGMGGMLMAELVEKGRTQMDNIRRLVVSPHLDADAVRRALGLCGWKILLEDVVKDKGKYYPVIAAEKGQEEDSSRAFLKWGRPSCQQSPALLAEWLEAESDKKRKILARLEQSGMADGERAEELARELEEIKEVLEHVDDHRRDC